MEGEITCQMGRSCKVHENKKEKSIARKTICRIITCTGVGIILLLAVPIVICSALIAALWFLTDKTVSLINRDKDNF